jgi:hypothetical protein
VLPAGTSLVLVHDAARCLVPPEVVERVVAALRAGAPAVVPVLPVTDTVKQVDAAGTVVRTVPRADLRAVQTPQGFARDVLERAHDAGASGATDDASLLEALGLPVTTVVGDERAFKVTRPLDCCSQKRSCVEMRQRVAHSCARLWRMDVNPFRYSGPVGSDDLVGRDAETSSCSGPRRRATTAAWWRRAATARPACCGGSPRRPGSTAGRRCTSTSSAS